MTGWRAGLGAAVVVALAVTVWALVATGDDPVPTTLASPSTVPPTSNTTTPTTVTVPTTTTDTPVTSTVVPDTTLDADARTEEVRLILEDLYFRWFDAIYHNDEEAVREVVATEGYLEAFDDAVVTADWDRAPNRADISIGDLEVLRDAVDCLVVYATLDVSSWQGEGATATGVNVLYPISGEWRFATAWVNRNDLWETDCEAERSDVLP